jgi:hypothetical protein
MTRTRIRTFLTAALLLIAAGRASALTNEALLDSLQQTAFKYFWYESNPTNGLIKDRSTSFSPCSIASLGFGLSAICIGIDHGWVARDEGRGRILTALQTLWTKPQGTGSGGYIGYQGLYYHFLDMTYGTRTWDCELSTIDSALLFAGVVDAKQYFSTSDPLDVQVRALADSIYYRADWEYFRNGSPGIRMGWRPDTGFSSFGEWVGYNEAMILYILAAGSPTHPVTDPTQAWNRWTSGYNWGTQYGYTYLIFPPLFGHQYSHCWIDFRGIQDAYMRAHGSDYFVNSIRATLAQRAYCIANPAHRVGYGPNLWGLTASDDPNGYLAHGAPPPQNDNGTIAPTAAGGAVPFAPPEALIVLQNLYNTYHFPLWDRYGFRDAFNLTVNWWDLDYLGIDEGPIIVGIENYRTGRVWSRFMQNPDVQRGLERCGFIPEIVSVPGAGPSGSELTMVRDLPSPLRGPGSIEVALSRPGPLALHLFDPQGREMLSAEKWVSAAGRTAFEFNPRGWPSGVYFYRLESGKNQLDGRCVIIR